jgi:hypothetical protein
MLLSFEFQRILDVFFVRSIPVHTASWAVGAARFSKAHKKWIEDIDGCSFEG